jgi:hypothetical protein
MADATVRGFCYLTNKEVALTPAQWRAKYPPASHIRRTGLAPGETWYNARGTSAQPLVAEAYGIIPAGRAL